MGGNMISRAVGFEKVEEGQIGSMDTAEGVG